MNLSGSFDFNLRPTVRPRDGFLDGSSGFETEMTKKPPELALPLQTSIPLCLDKLNMHQSLYTERSSFNGYHPTVVFGEMRGQTFWQKKGTGILQNFRRDLTLHSAKLEIKRIFRESFRLTASRDKPWSTLCKKSHGIPSSPRAAAVAEFRLLTGHDCLCAHPFRFNLVISPICVLCDTGQHMTAAHSDECSALNYLNCIVKRYWRARCLMT
ncbi:uncharacterized protein TNCV_2436341 [Trichonephila clavipes]|nr:uncharacterized protein TNCV_2436341 [Trichonephila clavipes]